MKKILLMLVAFIFFTGDFAQKITEVKTNDLPKPIEKYIHDNMPGASIFKSVKLEDKGILTYNVAIDLHGHKHVLVFNKDGKFLKKGDETVNSTNKSTVNKANETTNLPQLPHSSDKSSPDNQNNKKK